MATSIRPPTIPDPPVKPARRRAIDRAIPNWGVWGMLGDLLEDQPAAASRGVNVVDYGADRTGATESTDAFRSAMSDAHDLADAVADIYAYPVYVPPGKYLVKTLSFDGLKATLVGDGPAACRLKAHPDITGYVVDLDGWDGFIGSHRGSAYFGGFTIEGTGQADATKSLGGLRMSSAGNFLLADITVTGTGGPGMFVGAGAALGAYERITLQRPVGADSNDVPYLHVKGWHNGNVWYRLGLRSLTSDADGSAVVLLEHDTPTAHDTSFLYPWTEFLHTPEGGAVFDVDAKHCLFDWVQLFDSGSAVENPTENSIYKLRGTDSTGGNEIRGLIPGRGTNSTSVAYGVIVEQLRNRIVGVRGYRDNNVLLKTDVEYTHVELGGSVSGTEGVGGAAVVDNSGKSNNWIIDRTISTRPAYTPSNVTEDRVLDADSTTTAELADVLGTLISDLQDQGVIS